jgi:hypothetical protein
VDRDLHSPAVVSRCLTPFFYQGLFYVAGLENDAEAARTLAASTVDLRSGSEAALRRQRRTSGVSLRAFCGLCLWGEDFRVLLSESLLPVLSTGFVTATKVSAIIENSRSLNR